MLVNLVRIWISSSRTILNWIFAIIFNFFIPRWSSIKNLLFQRKLSWYENFVTAHSWWMLGFILSIYECLLVQLAHLKFHTVIWYVVNAIPCYWLTVHKFLKASCVLRFWLFTLFRTFWISQILIKLNTIYLVFKTIT